MKYQAKISQSQIFKAKPVTEKEIAAIKIDVVNKTVKSLVISNSLTSIKRALGFYQVIFVRFEEAAMDHMIVSADEDDDTLKRPSFTIKGNESQTYFGHALVVQLPKSGDSEKLQSAKLTVQEVQDMVVFT